MSHRMKRNGASLVAVSLFVVACGGTERAPRQKVSGVDRAQQQTRAEPAEVPAEPMTDATDRASDTATAPEETVAEAEPTSGSPKPVARNALDRFVGEVADTVTAAPGLIAVFPALSRNEMSKRTEVNGLGDRLATEIADGLRMRGIEALSGAELRNDILASNRGLAEFRSVADVYWIAERIGAKYVVFGTVQRTVYDRMNRDEVLDLSLQCIRTADRGIVARERQRMHPGPVSIDYARDYVRSSEWRIGDDAEPMKSDTAREVRMAVRTLVAKVADGAGKKLGGQKLAVDPCLIRSVSGPRAGNDEMLTTSFARALATAESRAAADGAADARQAALEHGPVTIHGKEYETLGAALDVLTARRAALRRSTAGELSIDIARAIATEFRSHGTSSFEVRADDVERDRILGLIRREAASYRADGAFDPKTIGELKSDGATMLVASTLRPFVGSYRLRIALLDVATGAIVSEGTTDFEARFKNDLDALTAN